MKCLGILLGVWKQKAENKKYYPQGILRFLCTLLVWTKRAYLVKYRCVHAVASQIKMFLFPS